MDAITRPEIDLQLPHATGQHPVLPWVAVCEPVNPLQYARLAYDVPERLQPLTEACCFFDLHRRSVAYRIQWRKPARPEEGARSRSSVSTSICEAS